MKNCTFTVYVTTNIVNGKIYVGCTTKNLSTSKYIGSGLLLRRAVSKYGRENFTIRAYATFKNKKEMYAAEIRLITELDSRNLDKGYNIARGGAGGDTITSNPNKKLIYAKQKSTRQLNNKTQTKEQILKRSLSTRKTFDKNPDIVKKRNNKLKNVFSVDGIEYHGISAISESLGISYKTAVNRLNSSKYESYIRITPKRHRTRLQTK